MWRRACLGVHDDRIALSMVWVGAVVAVLFVGAGTRGWWWGLAAAVVVGAVPPALFRWRRRRWERVVSHELPRVLAEAESLLRRRV